VHCAKERRSDDHLSLVAGISRLQRTELVGQQIETLQELAEMTLPVPFKPCRGSVEGITRVREQARVQVQGRDEKRPVHEILEIEEGRGFCRLPEPSEGDVFFDLEGDPFVGDGGREYLFGWAYMLPASWDLDSAKPDGVYYQAAWVWTAEEEKAAFETFVDEMMVRTERWPDFHIYHYAPYEPAALKRLMGRYATREQEVDQLLRAARFVDLYAVARQSVRASVEKYSIKDLEPFFGFERETDLHTANDQRHALQIELELENVEAITQEMQDVVESYNKDDCISTLRLRDWLEGLREAEIAGGKEVARPDPPEEDVSEHVTEEEARAQELADRLAGDVPTDKAERSDEEQARWVLAQLLSFHRREDKAVWWEFFRLRDLVDEELLDERHAIGGLELVETGKIKNSVLHTYQFPTQEVSVREGDELKSSLVEKGNYGVCDSIDQGIGTVGIKKTRATAEMHAETVFVHTFYNRQVQKDSLMRLGEWVVEHGVSVEGYRQAGRTSC